MGMFDDALKNSVPGGNLATPIAVAAGALILGKLFGGSSAHAPAAPPAVSLPMRSLRPPTMLPGGGLVGTDCGGAAGACAELPPNSLPRIKAPAATAIGVARLPPGTEFLRASSNIPIASS